MAKPLDVQTAAKSLGLRLHSETIAYVLAYRSPVQLDRPDCWKYVAEGMVNLGFEYSGPLARVPDLHYCQLCACSAAWAGRLGHQRRGCAGGVGGSVPGVQRTGVRVAACSSAALRHFVLRVAKDVKASAAAQEKRPVAVVAAPLLSIAPRCCLRPLRSLAPAHH